MKNIVQGNSDYKCECRRHNFECEFRFMEDKDYEILQNYLDSFWTWEHTRNNQAWRFLRNEHVPLKGCVVVKKFERSSIIYYT